MIILEKKFMKLDCAIFLYFKTSQIDNCLQYNRLPIFVNNVTNYNFFLLYCSLCFQIKLYFHTVIHVSKQILNVLIDVLYVEEFSS